MAIYHLSAKPVQRSKGRSATAAAAYRAGEKLKDERTGEVHDYTQKRGVEHSEILTPNGENINRERLWNLAEFAEKRKDGTPAREYELALPDELDKKQRLELARSFAEYLAGHHGCAVDLSIHAPGKESDHRNHHAHLLCTTRRFEPGGGLGGKCDVELSDRDRAKKGLLGRKTELDQTREHWERLANQTLERAGHPERIDRRSLSEQGLKRRPGLHLGPTATAMERRGVPTGRGGLARELTERSRKPDESQAIPTATAKEAAAKLVADGMSRVMAQVAQMKAKEEFAKAEAERLIKQQEKAAELQKEKQDAEKNTSRSRNRGPGMGR